MLVVALALGPVFAWHWWSARGVGRHWAELARRGALTHGIIVAIRRATPQTWTAVGRVPALLVRSFGHVIDYRYSDVHGISHADESGWLDDKGIAKWRIGDRGTIAHDPEQPEISVGIG